MERWHLKLVSLTTEKISPNSLPDTKTTLSITFVLGFVRADYLESALF